MSGLTTEERRKMEGSLIKLNHRTWNLLLFFHNLAITTSYLEIVPSTILGDPLVFIVVVLLFYSCGIAISMIIYMKKVRKISSKAEIENHYIDI